MICQSSAKTVIFITTLTIFTSVQNVDSKQVPQDVNKIDIASVKSFGEAVSSVFEGIFAEKIKEPTIKEAFMEIKREQMNISYNETTTQKIEVTSMRHLKKTPANITEQLEQFETKVTVKSQSVQRASTAEIENFNNLDVKRSTSSSKLDSKLRVTEPSQQLKLSSSGKAGKTWLSISSQKSTKNLSVPSIRTTTKANKMVHHEETSEQLQKTELEEAGFTRTKHEKPMISSNQITQSGIINKHGPNLILDTTKKNANISLVSGIQKDVKLSVSENTEKTSSTSISYEKQQFHVADSTNLVVSNNNLNPTQGPLYDYVFVSKSKPQANAEESSIKIEAEKTKIKSIELLLSKQTSTITKKPKNEIFFNKQPIILLDNHLSNHKLSTKLSNGINTDSGDSLSNIKESKKSANTSGYRIVGQEKIINIGKEIDNTATTKWNTRSGNKYEKFYSNNEKNHTIFKEKSINENEEGDKSIKSVWIDFFGEKNSIVSNKISCEQYAPYFDDYSSTLYFNSEERQDDINLDALRNRDETSLWNEFVGNNLRTKMHDGHFASQTSAILSNIDEPFFGFETEWGNNFSSEEEDEAVLFDAFWGNDIPTNHRKKPALSLQEQKELKTQRFGERYPNKFIIGSINNSTNDAENIGEEFQTYYTTYSSNPDFRYDKNDETSDTTSLTDDKKFGKVFAIDSFEPNQPDWQSEYYSIGQSQKENHQEEGFGKQPDFWYEETGGPGYRYYNNDELPSDTMNLTEEQIFDTLFASGSFKSNEPDWQSEVFSNSHVQTENNWKEGSSEKLDFWDEESSDKEISAVETEDNWREIFGNGIDFWDADSSDEEGPTLLNHADNSYRFHPTNSDWVSDWMEPQIPVLSFLGIPICRWSSIHNEYRKKLSIWDWYGEESFENYLGSNSEEWDWLNNDTTLETEDSSSGDDQAHETTSFMMKNIIVTDADTMTTGQSKAMLDNSKHNIEANKLSTDANSMTMKNKHGQDLAKTTSKSNLVFSEMHFKPLPFATQTDFQNKIILPTENILRNELNQTQAETTSSNLDNSKINISNDRLIFKFIPTESPNLSTSSLNELQQNKQNKTKVNLLRSSPITVQAQIKSEKSEATDSVAVDKNSAADAYLKLFESKRPLFDSKNPLNMLQEAFKKPEDRWQSLFDSSKTFN